MIKIRLARGGKKNDPFYRVVAIEKWRKRGGKPLAILGYWHPSEKVIKLKTKEIDKWVEKGARLSSAVSKLLTKKKK